MAVQSTVGSSIIDMITGVGRSGQQLAATRAQEINNTAGYQALDRKASLDLMDEIEGAGNYRVDPTSTEGQLFKYDFVRLAKERPDLAKRILNRDSRFNRATDENGRVIETQIDSFQENADGSFSVVVTRPDGKKAPVTNNRTAQDDDVVAQIPLDEFGRYGSDIMTSIRGADGASTYMRDGALISQGMISQAAKDAAAEKHADDPTALSQLVSIINSATGEDLDAIATDLGIDPVGIRAEVEQNSAPEQDEPQTEAPAEKQDAPLTKLEELDAEIDHVEERIANGPPLARRALRQRLNKLKKERRNVDPQTEVRELDEKIAQTEDRLINGPPLAKQTLRIKLDKLKKEREALAPEAKPDTTEDMVDTTEDMVEAGIEAPVPVRTEEDVKNAIIESLENPSDELAAKVAALMKKKGITKPADLSKLPSQEVNMAVWLMSSRMPGTVEAKLKVANELFNFANTGSMSTTADMQRKTDLAVYKFQLANQKHYRDEIAEGGVEFAKAVDSLGVVQAGTINDDGGAMEPTKEATIELGKILTLAANLQGSDKGIANRSVATEAFMYHLQGIIASDVKGWTDFQGMWDDFWNDNGSFKAGNDALSGLIRAKTDSTGKVTGLIFSDGKGGSNDYTVTLSKLSEYYAGDLLDEITKLAKLNSEKAAT
jgi:transcriptional regulator with XRE-family HTH domain